ncbi:diadenylate cyclase CdaA [Flavicella sp.]|uniref:diadenylate cyclase CdaA n=1 Tax=Flavicella sp. TaxID=2957742 RepID=UPI0030165A68
MDFIEFTFLDFLDITLVGVLLYYVYKLLKGTVAINIFIGITIVFLIYKITQALKMEMLSSILEVLVGGGAIAMLIIFHPELRKFLLMLGSANIGSRRGFIKQLKFLKTEINIEVDVESIVLACSKMSKSRTGALLVIERHNSLDFVKEKGDFMNAEINVPLLESIFYKNSPLHDGATIIKENFIVATRVVLPLSDKNLPSRFGLRHRAAIGITERTDCICIAVSEETGKISLIKDGEFELFTDQMDLVEKLKSYLA